MVPARSVGWKEQLPWVLLDLRTASKANGDASPNEKVYGETLAIPGEFFLPSADGADTPLPRLRELTQKFTPCHKTFTDRTTTYSPPALHSCSYVFVRVDAHQPSLTRPYRVIRWAAKVYLLDIHGQEDWITIDRLKPAFLLDSKGREEEGRCPRVPPQYLPTDTPLPHQSGVRGGQGNTSSQSEMSVPPHAHSSSGTGARSDCLSICVINVIFIQ
ncbi:uncharacterized protein [Macrobrachium rosenbergii]|uniref:uncharacterized protein n=1 Tax=Macrobrachium rosenbergii TaxID=79674 RepID=UPI0034D75461